MLPLMAAMRGMVDGWKCYLFWVPREKMLWVSGQPQLSDNFSSPAELALMRSKRENLILILQGGEETFPWSIWLILSQPIFSSAAGTKMPIWHAMSGVHHHYLLVDFPLFGIGPYISLFVRPPNCHSLFAKFASTSGQHWQRDDCVFSSMKDREEIASVAYQR